MKVITQSSDVVTVQVPFRIVKRGGRKEMQVPAGAPRQRKPEPPLFANLSI